MSSGWVKIHRKMLEWEWYTSPKHFKLFMHIIFKCNHKRKTWRGININEGQFLTGRKVLSQETGLSEQNVRTVLRDLESTSEVTIVKHSQYSMITLTNWHEYQVANQVNNQQLTTKQPGSNQALTTTKNVKNEKNENKKADVTTLKTQTIEVIEYFNLVTGKNYKATDPVAVRVIISLLKESYTVKDFKHVIDVKYEEWGEQVEYESRIRPLTFFAYEKFSSYLNQTSESQIEHEREMRLAKALGVAP